MDSSSLIGFGKAYSSLGGAVQEQLDTLMDGQWEYDESVWINPAAIDLMEERLVRSTGDSELQEAVGEIAYAINRYRAFQDGEDPGPDPRALYAPMGPARGRRSK